MATHLRLPKLSSIVNTQLLIGRVVVTLKSGKERSFPYERLTEAQENKLRSLAQPLPKKQVIKASKSRSASQPRQRHNYAADVTRSSVLVNLNGNFYGVVEA